MNVGRYECRKALMYECMNVGRYEGMNAPCRHDQTRNASSGVQNIRNETLLFPLLTLSESVIHHCWSEELMKCLVVGRQVVR